ncbi:hypothetical protein PQX77_016953 [Marasmius sp. AFHP31]|nr:hypothetical protein PQX77_016953 [Marasmius sp. AFHP31]
MSSRMRLSGYEADRSSSVDAESSCSQSDRTSTGTASEDTTREVNLPLHVDLRETPSQSTSSQASRVPLNEIDMPDSEVEAAQKIRYIERLEDQVNNQLTLIHAQEALLHKQEHELDSQRDRIRELETYQGHWYQLAVTVAERLSEIGGVLNDAVLLGIQNIDLPNPPSIPESDVDSTEGLSPPRRRRRRVAASAV